MDSLTYRRGNVWTLDIGPCPGAPADQVFSLAGKTLVFLLKRAPADATPAIRHEQAVPETPASLAGRAALIIPSTLTWVPVGEYCVEIQLRDLAGAVTLYPGADEEYAVLSVLPTLELAP